MFKSYCCTFLVLPFSFVAESPRWLYVKNRTNEADEIMKKMAKMNRTSVPDVIEVIQEVIMFIPSYK